MPGRRRSSGSGSPATSRRPTTPAQVGNLWSPSSSTGEPVLPELRDLARAELAAAGIDDEEIAVVSGALDGIERALGAQLRPGDVVAVEDPGFAGLFDLLRALGLALRPVSIDSKGMLPAALAEAIDEGASAAVFNPRGQNPTGASLDVERARELRRVLDRHPDVMVLEDDHLGPIAGAPRLTLTGGRQRWAAALSLAKSLGPDLRLAILAGDSQTMSRVRGRQAVGPHWVSHLLQRLVAMLWSDPEVIAALERAAEAYGERRERFVEALTERGIEAQASAGIAVWIPVPEETHVVQSLLERGWAVSPGAPYRLQSERAIRITISTLRAQEADELAVAIKDALRPASHTRTA